MAKKKKQEKTSGIEAKAKGKVFRVPPAHLQFGLSLLLSVEGKKPVGGIISMGYKSGEGLFIQSDIFRILFPTDRQEQDWELKMEATDNTIKALSALAKLIGNVEIAPDVEFWQEGEKLKVKVGKTNSTLNVGFPNYEVSSSCLSVKGLPSILEFPTRDMLLDPLEGLACVPQMKEFDKSGILVRSDGHAIEVLSTDGRQLYRCLIPVEDTILVKESVKFWTLPQEVSKLVKVMREFPKGSKVVVRKHEGNWAVEIVAPVYEATLLVRAQEGEPPDFDRVIKDVGNRVKAKVSLSGDGFTLFKDGMRILQKSLPRTGAVYIEFSEDGGYLKTYSDEVNSETEGEYTIEPEYLPGLPRMGVGGWWNGKAIYEFVKQVDHLDIEFSSYMQVPVAWDVEGMGILKLSSEKENGGKMELYIAPYRIDPLPDTGAYPVSVERNSEMEENVEQEVEDEGEVENSND
jgi:hypothetical protein